MSYGDVGFLGFGSSRRLELPTGTDAEVSQSGRAALRYNRTTDQLEVSLSGATYIAINTGAGATSPWVDDGGGNVRLQNITNDVVIGAASPPAGESLYVTGGTFRTNNQSQLGAAAIGTETVRVGTNNSNASPGLLVQPGAAHTGNIFAVNDNGATLVLGADDAGNTVTRQQQLFDVASSPAPLSASYASLYNNGGAPFWDDGGGPQELLRGGGGIAVTSIDFPDNTASAFQLRRVTGTGAPGVFMEINTPVGARTMIFGDAVDDPLSIQFRLAQAAGAMAMFDSSGNNYFEISPNFGQMTFGNATTDPDFIFRGDGPVHVGWTATDNNHLSIYRRGSAPAAAANAVLLYGLVDAGVASLWGRNSNGDEVNLTAVPEITGDRIATGDVGPALDSLLTELDAMGFVTDNTTVVTTYSTSGIITATFEQELDNGNSGAAFNVNWPNAQNQRLTLTDNATLTFTAPPGVGSFRLKLIQDGTGSRTVAWPGTVQWPGGTAPTLSTAAGAVDLVSLYYDGTNYLGVAGLNFL